jgi:tetratricopeptide (TPR) repeat protein
MIMMPYGWAPTAAAGHRACRLMAPHTLNASGLLSPPRHRLGWLPAKHRARFGRRALHRVIVALTGLGLLDLTDYIPTPRTEIRRPYPQAIPCLAAHPLVSEVNAWALREDKALRQKAVSIVIELVAAAAQRADARSPADAAIWPLLAPHIGRLAASGPQLSATDSARFAAAADRVAMGLRHGGDYAAALHCLTGSREAVSQLAPDDPAVLALRNSYAYVIDDLGRFAEAEAEYRTVLAARIRSLGAKHPLTLTTWNHLAYALSQQRRFSEAETEYRQVLKARSQLLGPEHSDTLTTQKNLADVLYGQKRYEEAAEHYEHVLNAQLRTLRPDHPRTLTTRNSLARNRDKQGDHIEAEKEFRAILELRRDSRGAEHPSTLTTQYDLATSLASQGHLAEARSEFEVVLDARRRLFGDTHPETVATAQALNGTTARQPRPDRAEPTSQNALQPPGVA